MYFFFISRATDFAKKRDCLWSTPFIYVAYRASVPRSSRSSVGLFGVFYFFLLFIRQQSISAKLYKSGKRIGGVYKINPDGAGPDFEVFCDQTPAGGGWTMA